MTQQFKCVLCDKVRKGNGYNPEPISEGKCCKNCYQNQVITARKVLDFLSLSTLREVNDG